MSQADLNITIDHRSAVPLYEQICQQIRAKIESRALQPGTSLPTNHELCDQLQIAYKTAQRAMSTLAQEGYVSRQARRGTVVKGVPRRGIVAIYSWMELFGPESKHEYYRLLISSLGQQLEAQGTDFRMYLGSETSQSANTACDDLLQHIDNNAITGILIVNHFPRYEELARHAQQMRIPIVSLTDNRHTDSSVLVDIPAYVKSAVDHLHQQGRRRIGVIYSSESILLRSSGRSLKQILADSGCKPKASWIVGRPDTEDGGSEAIDKLPVDEIDGLIIADDIMALGVDRRLYSKGINVPGDLMVTTLWQKNSKLQLSLPFVQFEVDVAEQARLSLTMLQATIDGQRIKSPHITITPIRHDREKCDSSAS